MALKTTIESQLIQLIGSPINPDRSNSGKTLWTIFFWKAVSDIADKAFKTNWESAVAGGLIDKDEKLRKLSPGQHLVAESNSYSVLVKVSEPRRNFDRDKFLDEAAKKFKIDRSKLDKLVETCTIPGNPALTKDIVEVEK